MSLFPQFLLIGEGKGSWSQRVPAPCPVPQGVSPRFGGVPSLGGRGLSKVNGRGPRQGESVRPWIREYCLDCNTYAYATYTLDSLSILAT